VVEHADVKFDHPINLRDESLLQDKSILPHMRFIFHENDLLQLTFQLLIVGMKKDRSNNFPKTDLAKIELSLKFFVDRFYKMELTFAD
jgi:hypothetical protein